MASVDEQTAPSENTPREQDQQHQAPGSTHEDEEGEDHQEGAEKEGNMGEQTPEVSDDGGHGPKDKGREKQPRQNGQRLRADETTAEKEDTEKARTKVKHGSQSPSLPKKQRVRPETPRSQFTAEEKPHKSRRRRPQPPQIYDDDQYEQDEQMALQTQNYDNQIQSEEQQPSHVQQGKKDGKNPLKLRLDLNLEVDIELKAHIHGDLTLALLT